MVAEEQTGGHGRLTRGFYSPFAKGIWFSLILRPKFFPMEASKCTLLAAIGVCRGIRRLGLKDAGIKWPNDILYHGKKMVGILTEMSASMEKIDYIIMGIGINTGMKKSEFPEAFRETSTSFLNEASTYPAKIFWRPFWQNWRRNIILLRLKVLTRCWKTGRPFPLLWDRKYGSFSEMTATQARLSISIRMDAFW